MVVTAFIDVLFYNLNGRDDIIQTLCDVINQNESELANIDL